jgi:uncharacterized protein
MKLGEQTPEEMKSQDTQPEEHLPLVEGILHDAGKMADRGGKTLRMCVVTRDVLPVDDLLRFVVSGENVLTPDLKRKLPGRGVHVRASAAALREAIRRKAFERALKCSPLIPATLAGDLERLMRQDALRWISLANKAGLVVTGFSKVEACLDQGAAVAVMNASDAAADGQRKLAQATLRGYGDRAPALPVITSFSSVDFQLALGRDLVIHAALQGGPAAQETLIRWHRLMRYEAGTVPAKDKTAKDKTTKA